MSNRVDQSVRIYASRVSALPKSISNKRAAKKRLSLSKMVFLDVRTTFRHIFPFSELKCLPRGDPRNLDPTIGNSFISGSFSLHRIPEVAFMYKTLTFMS